MFGIADKAIAPITGNAAFAAFLKKSLRDWSSSFLFLSSMTIKFKSRLAELPNQANKLFGIRY